MKRQIELLAEDWNIDFSFPWGKSKALAFVACLSKRNLQASTVKVDRIPEGRVIHFFSS